MLSTEQVKSMQAVQVSAQPETVVLQRATTSRTRGGGTAQAWADHLTTTARYANPTGEEIELGAKLEAANAIILTLPETTDVKTSDRALLGSRVFEIKAILTGSWGTALRCLCAELP